MNLFENTTSIIDAQIEELFNKKKDSEIDLILKILSLIIYKQSTNTDIVELYRLLGPEKLSQLIMLFDGRTIKLPPANEFKENLVLCLVYYYKEIKNEPWSKIKEHFPFEISGISYGIQVKQLSNFILMHMETLFKKMDNNKE
jgi:hypothetical protein